MKLSISIPILTFLILLQQTGCLFAQKNLGEQIKHIDFYYENASPLSWDLQGDTAVKITFLYDYERDNINRQSTHFNFRIEAEKGTELNLVLSGFEDIYNGVRKTSYGRSTGRNVSCYFSEDYEHWTGVETALVPDSDFDLQVKYTMKTNSVYVAKLPVYSLTHLEAFKQSIAHQELIKIIPIGTTVEKRPLEIIRVGYPNAEKTIVLRARAHAWEPGGNWVVEGLIRDFFESARTSDRLVNQFCLYIMPMANKDAVFRGMTRFNLSGSDLNRGWGFEADSLLTPENYYLEQFIKELIRNGKKPDFVMDFHNDNYGNIHVTQPKEGDAAYDRDMEKFYRLMQEKTWFSAKIQKVYVTDPKRLYISAGLYQRYDITGCVLELNADWIERLNKIPSAADWRQLGAGLNEVFYAYFQP